ncbi:MAG: TetR/AcrR family transcriptional regulator [Elusimicrobia bacterium]|nr:TetR/AcrR family transcriptional regulator [Elusimicrobiota bacterium]
MPAHPRPVVRDPDAKRRRILEAARRLLVADGFQDVVLDDVAREADVAKGTLFLYFKNKEELVFAAFSDLVESLGLELAALAKTGVAGRELLVAAARVILGHFDRHRDFMGQIGSRRLPGCGARSRERLLEKYRANHAHVVRILELAAKDGAPPPDAEFAAAAFIGLCRSAAVRKIVRGDDGALEAEAEAVVSFFLNGSGLSL